MDTTLELTTSVVICAFTLDRWDALRTAVASVHDQNRPGTQVVVVIDHNDELLSRACTEFAADTVLANTQEQGLSGARNTGLTAASGDVVVFLDDDARACPGWLDRLLSHYDDPTVMGVGGAATPDWQGAPSPWFPPEFQWVVGCSYTGLPTRPMTVRNFIGANMSYRRDAFDAVGGFSYGLGRVGSKPLGCEETEFGIRVRNAMPGSRFVYDPTAEVMHTVPASRTSWSYFRRRCWSEGLSKAVVARLNSSEEALESERIYVRSVLPSGVINSLRGRRGSDGVRRAAAIVSGLLITAAGYLRGRLAPA